MLASKIHLVKLSQHLILDILDKVKTVPADGIPYRPLLPKDSCPDQMANLIYRSWAENPAARPELTTISKELKLLNGGR